MGTLVFVCPATGLEVFTGLEMDQDAFAYRCLALCRTFDVPIVPNPIRFFQKWPLGWQKANVE